MMLRSWQRWILAVSAAGIFTTGGVVLEHRASGPKSVHASTGRSGAVIPPQGNGSSSYVPTTVSGSGTPTNYTQAARVLADAHDPGLPTTVAKVNGWVVSGKEIAQMEVVLAKPGTSIGSSTLRREAFQAILAQYVQIQAAVKLGLLPSMSWTRGQAKSQGIPPTAQNLLAIRDTAAMTLYRGRVLGPQSANNSQAMQPHILALIHQANIQMFFHI